MQEVSSLKVFKHFTGENKLTLKLYNLNYQQYMVHITAKLGTEP